MENNNFFIIRQDLFFKKVSVIFTVNLLYLVEKFGKVDCE